MNHPFNLRATGLVFASVLLCACTEEPQSILSPGEALDFAAMPNLSAWSPAAPIAELNTAAGEGCPFLVKHGGALHFTRNQDLHVASWDDSTQLWGGAINLGERVNTPYNESCAVVLSSGREMIFYSDRPGGMGGFDLWSATRSDRRDDLGWGSPVNLGRA